MLPETDSANSGLLLFTKIPGKTPAKTRLAAAGLSSDQILLLSKAFLADSVYTALEVKRLYSERTGAELSLFFSSSPLCSSGELRQLFAGLPIAESDLDFSDVTFTEQKGDHFGEKLSFSLSKCFESGATSVVTFGSDSPLLSARRLLSALDAVELGSAVIGPSQGGGLYTFGLSAKEQKANFEIFRVFPAEDISAQLTDVERFSKYWHSLPLQADAELRMLEPFFDIDVEEDLVLAASIIAVSNGSKTNSGQVVSDNATASNTAFALQKLGLHSSASTTNNRETRIFWS